MIIYILTAILIILQVLDAWTTLEAFKVGATEGNPVMAKKMQEIGVIPALIFLKTVASLLFIGISWLVLQGLFFVQTIWIAALVGLIYKYTKTVISNWKIVNDAVG